MSWFFGKKKHHKESPPDSPEETSTSANDDYIIIEKHANPMSPTSWSSSGGLYPDLGNGSAGPTTVPSTPTQPQLNSVADNVNYLQGVPFKLNKIFDNDFEIDRLRVDEIMSFVLRIKNEDYDYDFSLERSTIIECGAE